MHPALRKREPLLRWRPRRPLLRFLAVDVDHSQKKFNPGMVVVVVEHGKKPGPELIERTNGIRLRWMGYWETTTGRRALMTTEVK